MKRITILIVGDQKLVRDSWNFIFSGFSAVHVLAECESVEEAIDKVKRLRPDIVIVDINLPETNGAEVISRIEKLSPGSRVLRSNGNKIYQYLFEQATNPALVVDFNGNLQDINPGLSVMLGYTKEELLHSNARQLLDQEELKIKPIRFDLLAAGENIINERKMVHKNGTVVFVQVNAKKITSNCILVTVSNITKQRETERVLQKSEADLHTIFDTTGTIYVLIDNHLRIISFNPRAVDFANKELGHSIRAGECFLHCFPADRQPFLLNQMKEVLTGKDVTYEVSYPQAGGLYNWYHVRIFPISKGDEHIYGLMMEVSDITRMKLLTQQLLAQQVQEQKNIIRAVLNAQEIERNRIGQELHDNINQLLSTIRLYITMVETDAKMREDLMESARTFIDLAIKEIRLLSRQQVTPQKKIDLAELIEELTTDLNENTRALTRFDCRVESMLPINEDLKLNIYRIVQEQVNNIIKYAAASTAFILISENKQIVKISIVDDGKGFDPSTRRKGVGITNMINRVESSNGTIHIESSSGKGCKIEIEIPRCQ